VANEIDLEALHHMLDLGAALKKAPKKVRTEIRAWNAMVTQQAGMTNKQIRHQWRGKA
jgi:hypothetical protein